MEEKERNVGKCAAENNGVKKGVKPSVIGSERELGKNIDMHLKANASSASVSENSTSLQNSSICLLQTGSFVVFDSDGRPLQCEHMVIGQSENGQLYVIPSNQLGGTQVLLPSAQVLNAAVLANVSQENKPNLTAAASDSSANTSTTVTPPNISAVKAQTVSSLDGIVPSSKSLLTGTPNWAKRLRSCEEQKIGDSYRGYCNTAAELEAVLLLHKQQTHSVFGTRQSPSPAKPASRLMWKSQYVPYDGIPFVNAGSRAIVMECQFGPRRKGVQPKKGTELETSQNPRYKATCPARIYIKKVRKFPDYEVPVDPKVDRKLVRQEQEKAFCNLKKKLWDTGGVIRYYIQLPTQKAHLYHDIDMTLLPPLPEQPSIPEEENEEDEEVHKGGEEVVEEEDVSSVPSRLHPLVAEKINELVSQGCNQVYNVRKQLRKFVECEMFKADTVPERHNLCYFPTVNDIKNHMHEAQKSLQLTDGVLVSGSEWKPEGENPLAETVTLTLTPASFYVDSPKEALLEGSDTLSPEAVQLFSSLTSFQPKIFAQLQGVQLQSATCPAEGSPAQQSVSASDPIDPSNPLHPQTLFLNPSSFLQSNPSAGEAAAVSGPPGVLGTGQLVDISAPDTVGTVGGVTQILLEDGQNIPVHIMDPFSIALRSSVEVKDGSEVKSTDFSTEQSRDKS